MTVNQEKVREAASRARPTVLAIRSGVTDRDGNEMFIHLIQEPGETRGEVLTRALQNGSITENMIPESIKGTGAEFQPPGSDVGPATAALLSAGATQQDLGRGFLALTTDRTLEDNARLAADEAPAREGLSEHNPKASMGGQFAGSVIPVPGGPVVQGVAGVTQGALHRSGRGEPTTGTDAALDASISVLPGILADRVLKRNSTNLRQQQVDLLEDSGVPLSPAERGQGRTLGAAERALEPSLESTFTGRLITQSRRRRQSQALNREISSTFGADLDNLGGDALEGVARELGEQFDTVLGDAAIGSLRLGQAVDDAKAAFTSGVVRPDRKIFVIADRVMEKYPEGITGKEYSGGLRSELLAESRSLWRDPRNHKNAQGIDALISRLDEAFEQAGGNTNEYAVLRHKWNMLRLTRTAVDAEGNVSARKLANVLRREGFTGDLREFVDAAASVTKPLAGNSGTADRLLGADFLGNVVSGRIFDPRNVVNAVPPLIEMINSGSVSRSIASAVGRGANSAAEAMAEFQAKKDIEDQGLLGNTKNKARKGLIGATQ